MPQPEIDTEKEIFPVATVPTCEDISLANIVGIPCSYVSCFGRNISRSDTNLHDKKKDIRTGPDVTVETLDTLKTANGIIFDTDREVLVNGNENISDLATRGEAKVEEIQAEGPVDRELTRFVPKEEPRSEFHEKIMENSDSLDRQPAKMIQSSELSALAPLNSGLIYLTKGRQGPSTMNFLGELAILLCKTRLAKLILIQTCRDDHRRDPGDTLVRSRSDAWMVSGKADYRLDKVETDDKGLVRAERHQGVDEAKASKENSLPYCSRKLIFMNMLQVRMTYREQMLQVKAEDEAHEEQAHDEEHVQVEEQVDDEEQDLIDKLEQVN